MSPARCSTPTAARSSTGRAPTRTKGQPRRCRPCVTALNARRAFTGDAGEGALRSRRCRPTRHQSASARSVSGAGDSSRVAGCLDLPFVAGHLQVTGRDDADRKQCRDHPGRRRCRSRRARPDRSSDDSTHEKRAVASAVRTVADLLGNTPAVCRLSHASSTTISTTRRCLRSGSSSRRPRGAVRTQDALVLALPQHGLDAAANRTAWRS